MASSWYLNIINLLDIEYFGCFIVHLHGLRNSQIETYEKYKKKFYKNHELFGIFHASRAITQCYGR